MSPGGTASPGPAPPRPQVKSRCSWVLCPAPPSSPSVLCHRCLPNAITYSLRARKAKTGDSLFYLLPTKFFLLYNFVGCFCVFA